MAELHLTGTSAGTILQANNSITSNQTFTFPDTGGELATAGSPKVFFYARPSVNTYISSGTGNLTYNVVDHNVGNVYDSGTSTFTAPQNGFYQINAQFFGGNGITSSERGAADLVITNFAQTPRFGRENDAEGFIDVGVGWSGYMSAGDQAYIRRFSGYLHTAVGYSFFSGYLIS